MFKDYPSGLAQASVTMHAQQQQSLLASGLTTFAKSPKEQLNGMMHNRSAWICVKEDDFGVKFAKHCWGNMS